MNVFKILLTRNYLDDSHEKMLVVMMPNGDVLFISEWGYVWKVAKDGVYMPQWQKIEADREFYESMFPQEGKFKNYEIIREGDKLVVKAGALQMEMGRLVEY
jgi:hypothetical protein